MPNYDLRCAECNKEFNIRASISDRTERRISCPECGSAELEAVFKSAMFYVNNKSDGCPNKHICGSSCSHH